VKGDAPICPPGARAGRRAALALAALALASPQARATSPAPPAPWQPGDPIPSLARAYRADFLVGGAVDSSLVLGAQADLVRSQFDVIVAENEMKPAALSPALGRYDFTKADAIVDWAVANGIKVRGHCLVWHRAVVPGMFAQGELPVSRAVLIERMRAYIHAVVGHFKGRVWAWDVVNEALVAGEPGVDDGWRRSPWLDIIGPEYVALAFQFAREADPGALLFYNDYETQNPAKRALIREMVRSIRARGAPIDGVGHQAHCTVAHPAPAALEATVRELAQLGLRNQITELDVSLRASHDSSVPPLTDQLRAAQVRRWADLFQMFRRNAGAIDAVLLWGVNDESSWLGPPDEPLLFSHFQPKPAFWEVLRAASPGPG